MLLIVWQYIEVLRDWESQIGKILNTFPYMPKPFDHIYAKILFLFDM